MSTSSLDRLREVLGQIHQSLDLARTLDAIARGVANGTGFSVAAVTMVLPNGDYQVVAVEGDDDARATLLGSVEPAATWERLYEVATPIGRLLWVDHKHKVLEETMTSWVPDLPVPDDSADPKAWHPLDVLFAPLVDSTGRRVGALAVDVPLDGRRPDADQLAELDLYAMQAALAIEHAHSFAAAQQNAVLRERERLAEDMHDLVAQGLYAASLDLDRARLSADPARTAELIDRATDTIEQAVKQLRSSIRGITTPVSTGDVRAVVDQIIDRAASTLGFRPSLRWLGEPSQIPEDVARDAFAVLSEALSNIAKHAQASAIEVSLAVTDSAVVLSVSDDGIGLGGSAGRGNSGLDTMRRRAARHGGRCEFTEAAPTGTSLTWRVPRV